MSTSDTSQAEFAQLLRPHLRRLYRLAYRLTGSAADAEDLVQEVLVKVYECRDELTSIRALEPWLGRVLYNQFVDNARRYARQRLHTVSLDAPEGNAVGERAVASRDPGPDKIASDGFDISKLNAALAQLSIDHRTVVLMHDSEGYKLEEIQIITGVPIGTLKSRLHRARARLREILTADGTFSADSSCNSVKASENELHRYTRSAR